jgi:predicted  nucleic acid-binding Zn ribbon protein
MTPTTLIDASQEEIHELLWDYLNALYCKGQIHEDYILVKNDVAYCAFVSLPERDSLDDKYTDFYARMYAQRVNKWFAVSIEYIGENIDDYEPCICENPSWYYLNTRFCDDSPVICGDCRKPRSLYRLPYIEGYKEFFTLRHWQHNHLSMERIWFNGVSDRFSYRQMNDPNSSLSKEGRKLCGAYEEATGKPFYYSLFYYRYSRKKNISCPICGKPWQEIEKDHYVSKICKDCRLIMRGDSIHS